MKTRSVDDIRVAPDDRGEHPRVVARVVLEIAVLDQDDVARRRLDARPKRRALADVHRREAEQHPAGRAELLHDSRRAIRRSVVDDNHLALASARQRRAEHTLEDQPERRLLVVNRDDDGDLHVRD